MNVKLLKYSFSRASREVAGAVMEVEKKWKVQEGRRERGREAAHVCM